MATRLVFVIKSCPVKNCVNGWIPHPRKWGIRVQCSKCKGRGKIKVRERIRA